MVSGHRRSERKGGAIIAGPATRVQAILAARDGTPSAEACIVHVRIRMDNVALSSQFRYGALSLPKSSQLAFFLLHGMSKL